MLDFLHLPPWLLAQLTRWLDWLRAPLHTGPLDDVNPVDFWHGVLMGTAGAVLVPVAVLAARYWKIVPGQDWPRIINHRGWQRVHGLCGVAAVLCLVAGVAMAFQGMSLASHLAHPHAWMGWGVMAVLLLLVVNIALRGSIGGPGRHQPRTLVHLHDVPGDHYDMTRRRRIFDQSEKMKNVLYEIRGPVAEEAERLELDGHRILKLNTGNPAIFGFEAPDVIVQDMIAALPFSQGYSTSKGIITARRAVVTRYEVIPGFPKFSINDVYLGNGVSELITMVTQALLNDGDEVLIPAPDYPLWTAAVSLAGGKPVHYICDEAADWNPDIADMRAKITERTKAIVVINPNNPTGAVYSPETLKLIVEIAREYGLLILADEIYDRILYDDATHTSIASLAPDLLCITFNGLSKTYRVAGYRAGWMVLTGPKDHARGFIEGLDLLSSTRLCANVPAQHAIQVALGGRQSIYDLTSAHGRLTRQRDVTWEKLNEIPGVSCVKPKGALYAFPKLDLEYYDIHDDSQLMLDLLRAEKILLVHGTGFNWPQPDHFRVVTLPWANELAEAIDRLGNFLSSYKQ